MKSSDWDPKQEQELLETLEAIALQRQLEEQDRLERLRLMQRLATCAKEPRRRPSTRPDRRR